MPRLYFALDLRDDPVLIEEYECWHQPDRLWPEVASWLRDSGVNELELYRCGNRMIQVLDVVPDYLPMKQRVEAASRSHIRAWEALMWRYQLALPFATPGEKWIPMKRLFSLRETTDVWATSSGTQANFSASETKANGG